MTLLGDWISMLVTTSQPRASPLRHHLYSSIAALYTCSSIQITPTLIAYTDTVQSIPAYIPGYMP